MADMPEGYFGALALRALAFALALALLWQLWRFARPRVPPARVATAFRWLLVALLYVGTASLILDLFMSRFGFRGDDPAFGFSRLLSGTAERPFAFRVLSPALIDAAEGLLPDTTGSAARRFLLRDSPLLGYREAGESWSLVKSRQWHVAYAYLFACLLGSLYAARHLARRVCGVSPLFADVAPAVALLFLPLTFHFGGYLYDFPELLLMLLCLVALAHGRLVAYYPLFALAVLNKESNVVVVAFFLAFLWDRLPRRALLLHAGAQLALGAATIGAMWLAFRDAGGSQAFFWLPLNALFWLSPQAYLSFSTLYGPLVPVPRGANLITLFLVAFLVGHGWSRKPPEVRRLLVFTAACTLPLFLAFAYLDEIRNLSLLYPALFLAGCHTVDDVYGRADAVRP